jgi:hypothetical protein
VLDDRELLKLESESDGGPAGSNGRGIATPSESVEPETSSSSGERSASPGSAERPKRSGMALCATRNKPGNSSSFHTTSRETMMPPHPPLADGSHSFQPLKSSGQPRKTHAYTTTRAASSSASNGTHSSRSTAFGASTR